MHTLPPVLILSFVFPPYPGIGGRRWAKFAKNLKRAGHPVYVIAAQNSGEKVSSWQKDIEGFDVTYIPTHFPAILGASETNSILSKAQYKIALQRSQWRTEGNFYDRAAFWKKEMLQAATHLIKQHEIRHVMSTGAPFHLLHHALTLKEQFPNLKLLCDFRDPWTDGEYLFGMNSLSDKRKAVEQKMEREVLMKADVVTSVADSIVEKLREKVPTSQGHFATLLNGYDPDDFKQSQNETNHEGEAIRFSLTGTLYPDIDYIFVPLLDALVKLKETKPGIYARLSFDFYGNAQQHHRKLVSSRNLTDIITFHGRIPLEQVFEVLAGTTYTMLFLHEHLAFSRSTKFYEYLAAKRKIVVFSAPGETGQHVEENGIGYGVVPLQVYEKLLFLVEEVDKGNLIPNPDYDIESFGVPALTEQLRQLFLTDAT